jgi:tyrosinase
VTAIEFDLELPPSDQAQPFSRADLTFYGLDHSGPSFTVHVFFDVPDATVDTLRTVEAGYVGSFVVFGHGGCFGDEGHCDVRDPVSAFDRRPPHQLVRATRVLIATDAVRRSVAAGADTVHVTAVAEVRASVLADPQTADDVLVIDQVALHTYL